MNKTKKNLWLLLTIAWSVWLVFFLFLHFLRDPGHVLLTINGDGSKNYFTYLYHILYGQGLWFDGMNYPYGEHLVYTDAQPALAVPLAMLRLSKENALAVMHLVLASSYVLGIVYHYKTLRYFRVRPLTALIFASLLIMMSPQLFRIMGHFALAYVSFVPMLLYFNIRYHYEAKRRYLWYLFGLGTVMAFLHPYFAGMMLIWYGGYTLGYLLTGKGKLRQRLRHLVPYLLSFVAVFAVVQGVFRFTDPVKDRPAYPNGTLYYITRSRDILSSEHSPIWQYARAHDIVADKNIGKDNEGYGYIGITVTVIAGIALLASLYRLVRRRRASQQALLPEDQLDMRVWLITGFTALALSMGMPFTLNMEWLLDYLSIFRQFRTLGRFNWLFYHVIGIYTVVALSRYYEQLWTRGKKILAVTLIVVPALVWTYETMPYIGMIREQSNTGHAYYDSYFFKNDVSWQQFLEEHHHKTQDFQALLLLPFVHVGTDKLAVRPNGGWLMHLGFRAALAMHLPIVDVQMSRSSWSLAEKQVRIAGGPFADKPLLRETKDDRPFLLMHFLVDPSSEDEWYLIRNCSDYIGHFSDCELYACYPARIRQRDSMERTLALQIAAQMKGTDTSIGQTGTWYVNHLDQAANSNALFGDGCIYAAIKGPDSLLADIAVYPKGDSQLYECSSWVLVDGKDYKSPYFTLRLLDSTGATISDAAVLSGESMDNRGLWFRTSTYVWLPPACRRLQWRIHNDNNTYKALDEILIRPADAMILSRDRQGRIMANNHLLQP